MIENYNFLSPLNFKFEIKRAPHLKFFVQELYIPGITTSAPIVNNPVLRVPQVDDHILFEEFQVTYAVDENMENFKELYDWLTAIHKISFEAYKDISSKTIYTGESLKSDMTIHILTSNKTKNIEINITDAFPVSMSGIRLTTMDSDVQYAKSTAVFRYLKYDIKSWH